MFTDENNFRNSYDFLLSQNNKFRSRSAALFSFEKGKVTTQVLKLCRKLRLWLPKDFIVLHEYCVETSITGCKYLGRKSLHPVQRIFWLLAFIVSLSASTYLIYELWSRYSNTPVIVAFQAHELPVDTIPFPAVTICNINKFPKSKVVELLGYATNKNHSKHESAKRNLSYVRQICTATKSFSKGFHFASSRGESMKNLNLISDVQRGRGELLNFAFENSVNCGELLRLCSMGGETVDCASIFKPTMTDYGMCCTFNMLPLPLLLKDRKPQNETKSTKTLVEQSAEKYWSQLELETWQKWNFDDGFVLPDDLEQPWRQKRAGLPYGLSVLVDTNLDDYYCPASDAYGIRYTLHPQVEVPRVFEFASVVDIDKEVYIEVHPEITNADDNIRSIHPKRRECYFGKERKLDFYLAYTGENCYDECRAKYIGRICACTEFFMPREPGARVCSTEPGSQDQICLKDAQMDLRKNVTTICDHCDPLCKSITYNFETTIADLQDTHVLWGDPGPKLGKQRPHWWNHKMSILHIYFGSHSTVPKFRKELYGIADLIANTGGILGLCLGFSILSGVEMIYFGTIHWFWRKVTSKKIKHLKIKRQVVNKFKKLLETRYSHRVIQLSQNNIPVYNVYDRFRKNSINFGRLNQQL